MRSDFETLEQYQDSMKKFNESTRMEFENFIQSHGSDRNKLQLRCTPYTDKKGGYGSFDLDFGLSAWQHQQSKVDELQKRVDAAIYLLPSLKAENDLWGCDQVERQIELLEQALKGGLRDEKAELQKRVDAALIVAQSIRNEIEHGHLSDDEAKTLASYADDLEQALKGGLNE